MKTKTLLAILCSSLLFLQCKKDKGNEGAPDPAKISFEFDFDETLARLDNLGQTATIPAGNAAQHPQMKEMSAHYIELAQDQWTQLGDGEIVYKAAETAIGGENAVDFDKAIKAGEGEKFLTLNVSDIAPGSYEWVRVSVTYQRYDVDVYYELDTNGFQQTGTDKLSLSSFVGFKTYITTHAVNETPFAINANKLQGFWMTEFSLNTGLPSPWDVFTSNEMGDAPATTVVNPNPNSPVPAGSCVVTGKLAQPLVITGNETEDIEVVLAFSINNSFEWSEINVDGKFEPLAGETVVDMGLRGLHPRVK